MVGVMRVKAADAAQHQLVAYCIRLAAESMRLYIFQQLSGQFDQFFYEVSIVFPSRADELQQVGNLEEGFKATKMSIALIIPTLSTPASTPKNGPACLKSPPKQTIPPFVVLSP
ncbi:hypothetical protein BGX20_010474 [Mortierella sp. AD010]|nr:hypothetical protein BGX20_010474 [Mortierella sp. AD010]